jgi:putative membrane protein
MSEPPPQNSSTDNFAGRLHPATLLFDLITVGRHYLIPAVLLLIIARDIVIPMILVIFVMPSVIRSLMRYLSYSYLIDGRELKISSGILRRHYRNIPLERVHDLRIEQTYLQRLFKVVVAYVETAGGEGPEATLSVLSADQAEALRIAIFAYVPAHHATRDQTVEPQLLHRVTTVDLLLGALSYKRMTLALALALGTFSVVGLDNVLGTASGEDLMNWSGTFVSVVRNLVGQGLLLILLPVLTFLVILVITLAVSMLWSATMFHNFTLSRIGEDLHRTYGLLTRRASSLPWHRIQVLEIEEDLIQRTLGLTTVRADTAGSFAEGAHLSGRDVLVPVLRRTGIESLLPMMLPDVGEEAIDWRQVSRFAIRRGTFKGGLYLGTVAIVWFLMFWNVFAFWPLLLVPIVYIYNVVQYRHLAYAYGRNYFHTRRGWLRHSTFLIPVRNIQAVTVHQGLFDRRLGLATLRLHTAGHAYTGGGPTIPNLPVAEAFALAHRLSQHTAATKYRW